MDKVIETEYAVIGGGVIGVLTARALLAAGAHVTLLEAGRIADGSSGGLGKRGLRSTGRALEELPFAVASVPLWKRYADEVQGGLPITWTGLVSLFGGSGTGWIDPAGVDDLIAAHAQAGARLERLSREEAGEAIGCVPQNVDFALYNADDGIGDHTEITRVLARDALAQGLSVLLETRVDRIAQGDVYELHTSGGVLVRARTVLVAGNVGTERLLEASFGTTLPLTVAVPQYCFLRPAEPTRWERLVEHATLRFAAKLVPSGEIMLSGGGRGFLDDDGVPTADPVEIRKNVARFVETFPSLASATLGAIDGSRGETMTPDGLPIIDRAPGHDELYFAAGWSGHGFMIAPAIAESLAATLMSGSVAADLLPFSLARFGDI